MLNFNLSFGKMEAIFKILCCSVGLLSMDFILDLFQSWNAGMLASVIVGHLQFHLVNTSMAKIQKLAIKRRHGIVTIFFKLINRMNEKCWNVLLERRVFYFKRIRLASFVAKLLKAHLF